MINSQFLAGYQAPAMSLEKKIILITGAGDGIGKAASLAFAEQGATVVLVGRTMAKLEAVYDLIEQGGGPTPAIFPLNLESATDQDYTALYDVLNEEFGQLDGLLHNAAELGPRSPLAQYAAEQWQKVMQVNLNAPFQLTKALLPLLNKASSSSVVFTSSGVGRQGKAFWGAYAASKAGIENLVQVWADELDGTSNVRINSINPGPIRTRMRANAFPAEDPTKVIEAKTIMQQYICLMNSDSAGTSGQQFEAQVAQEN